MRPEKVSRWREQLPPPFDKPSLIQKRRASAACLEVPFVSHNGAEDVRKPGCVKRRNSAHGTLDQSDRKVTWLRFIHNQYMKTRRQKSILAIEKLRRYISLCSITMSYWLI
jgi:hypothetical protein